MLALGVLQTNAQQTSPNKNPQVQLTPQQMKMLKQMGINTTDPKKAAEQIKQMKQNGQHPDFKAQGQKMVGDMMANSNNMPPAAEGYFTSNTSLVPALDVKRINSISKKIFSTAEMLSNTHVLYSKLMAKIPAAEKTIISTVTAQQTAAGALNSAAVTAMLQGHPQAAMGLAMQAVIAKPADLNCQNNLAALLNQNGYPENAMPYLNTLLQQVPNNSTVLNNLGYTWFNLGQLDSAQRILRTAGKINPENAETKVGEGVIEEKKGNKEEAGKKYEEAIVEAPSPFILNLLDNAGRANPYDNKTFDEIKSKITIYEYFKKDWITYPDLSNSVDGYQSDIAIKNGYHQMFENLQDKLTAIEDSIKNAKDGDLFIPTNKGAVNGRILIVISNYFGVFIGEYNEDAAALADYVKGVEEDFYKQSGKIDPYDPARCQLEHDLWNNYLKDVNPPIKEFYLKKQEEFRVWINAFITYSLLTNHQYKKHLLSVIYYVRQYIGHEDDLMAELKNLSPTCGHQSYNQNAITKVDDRQLPKLLCPVNINAQSTSNNTNTNISKSATCTAPNATVAIGSTEGGIAEPGKAGTPSVSSSQGETCSTGINEQDTYGSVENAVAQEKTNSEIEAAKNDEVKPVPEAITKPDAGALPASAKNLKAQEDDDLAPLTVSPTKEYKNTLDDLAPLAKIVAKHHLKKWLQDKLGTDCDELKQMDQTPQPSNKDIKTDLDQKAKDLQEIKDNLTKVNNPANAEKLESVKSLLEDIRNAQQSCEQKIQTDPGWQDKVIGPVPTIVNGLQTPGSNNGFIKGLFN